jgi:serine/threonine protein kinase
MIWEEPKNPAEALIGLELSGGWHVDSYIHRPPTSTGGNFSIGYQVHNNDGRVAYLKALDFSSAFNSDDPPRALEAMTKAYNFERDLLDKCKNNKLKRIVTPLDDGSIKVDGDFRLDSVSYLIFELAKGDIRKEVSCWHEFDLAWSLRSLHQSAVGLRQLHSIGIAHQDLKPSNVLVFPDIGSKIADLGRATYIHSPSVYDDLFVPGDRNYAPPEEWYGWHHSPEFNSRFVSDLYLFGNLIFFYFAQCSATQAIISKISQLHKKEFKKSDFLEDLPYFQFAFGEVLENLKDMISGFAGKLTDEIIMIASQLCEPDPRRRGDPKIMQTRMPKHDLQPYISRFDRLARLAEMRMI